MGLKMTRFSEPLDNEGNVTQIEVGFGWSEGLNNFNASVVILPSDIKDGTKLDDLTKNEILYIAASGFSDKLVEMVKEVNPDKTTTPTA